MSFFHKIFGTVAALNPMTGAEMLAAKEARRLTQRHGHPHVVARLPGGRFAARPVGGYVAPPTGGGGGYVAPPDPSAGAPDPSATDPSASAADPSSAAPDPSAAAPPDPSATPDPSAAGASMGYDSDLDSFHDGLSHFLGDDGLDEIVLTDNFHGRGGGGGGGRGGGGRGWGGGGGWGGWGYGYPYGYPNYDEEEVIYPGASPDEGMAPVVIVRRGSPWGMRG